MTLNEMITDLLTNGGAIVGSQECTEMEIANAQNTRRFCFVEESCGVVRRTKGWLDLQKKREVLYSPKRRKFIRQ